MRRQERGRKQGRRREEGGVRGEGEEGVGQKRCIKCSENEGGCELMYTSQEVAYSGH